MIQSGAIAEKFSGFNEHWQPKIIASLNGQDVKVVKVCGEFPWHVHENCDEMFVVWRGTLKVEFRDHIEILHVGQFLVVPRGFEHRTIADTEAEIIIFEPMETRNTGNLIDAAFTAPVGIRI